MPTREERLAAIRAAVAAQRGVEPEEPAGEHKGILGLGVGPSIGPDLTPDLNLGLRNLWDEGGQMVTGLLGLGGEQLKDVIGVQRGLFTGDLDRVRQDVASQARRAGDLTEGIGGQVANLSRNPVARLAADPSAAVGMTIGALPSGLEQWVRDRAPRALEDGLLGGLQGAGEGIQARQAGYDSYDDYITDTLGEERAQRFQGEAFGDRVSERGLLPVLVEDIGTASLVASTPAAAARAGAGLARTASGTRAAQATHASARLAAAADRLGNARNALLADPTLTAIRTPYRTAARAGRDALSRNADLVNRARGLDQLDDAAKLPELPDDVAEAVLNNPVRRAGEVVQRRIVEPANIRKEYMNTRAELALDKLKRLRNTASQKQGNVAAFLRELDDPTTGAKISRELADEIVGNEIAWRIEADTLRTKLDDIASRTGDNASDAAKEAAHLRNTERVAQAKKNLDDAEAALHRAHGSNVPESQLKDLAADAAAARESLDEALALREYGQTGTVDASVLRTKLGRGGWIPEEHLSGADLVKFNRLVDEATQAQIRQTQADAAKLDELTADRPDRAKELRKRGSDEAEMTPAQKKAARLADKLEERAAEARLNSIPKGRQRLAEKIAKQAEELRDLEAKLEELNKKPPMSELRVRSKINKEVTRGRRIERVTQAKRELESSNRHMRKVLAENKTLSEVRADRAARKAQSIRERLDAELDEPSLARVPANWQPLYHGYDALRRLLSEGEFAAVPGVAEILDEIPQTLGEIKATAVEAGFRPEHMRHFSDAQVKRLIWNNLQLGVGTNVTEEVAGTLKARTGHMLRQGTISHSMEAFAAASTEIARMERTNAFVNYIQDNVARRIEGIGKEIPDDMVPWDPIREHLTTGTELGEYARGTVRTTADQTTTVVPRAVLDQITALNKPYDHWALKALGTITNPWRTLVLTMSPGWYARNLGGNIMLATAAGANISDWVTAYQEWKQTDALGRWAGEHGYKFQQSTLANEVAAPGGGLIARLTGEAPGGGRSLIPKSTVTDAAGGTTRQRWKERWNTDIDERGRFKGSLTTVQDSLLRANGVVDEIARSAVYFSKKRKGLTEAEAMKAARTALVDYDNLSNFEREVVRSIVPFYAWQKGILQTVTNLALDHPARMAAMSGLAEMQQEYVADMLGVDKGDVPRYYRHLLPGGINIRGYNPFADSASLLSPEGIAMSLNPYVELAARSGLGAPEFFPDSYSMNEFGSPRANIDAGSAFFESITRSPAGRLLGAPGADTVQQTLGLAPTDLDAVRSRVLRALRQIEGPELAPNPETQVGAEALGLPAPLLPGERLPGQPLPSEIRPYERSR